MSSPRLDKLFHVLVILGGATGVAACEDDDASRRDRIPDAAAPENDGGMPCFCDVQACCDRSADPPTLEDGFTCCWSTTCG